MRRKGSQLSSLLCLLIVGLGLTTIVSLLIYSAFVADEESFMERDYRRGLEDAAASTNSSKTGTDLSSTTTTSACLYIMDDNHFLIEWLAYHYHVINLRHVILTTDPSSMTSPQHVLDRWRDLMSFELWTDADFLDDNFEIEVQKSSAGGKDPKLEYHRNRQASFNLECLKQHKQYNRGWTMVIDVDEYMTFNPKLRNFEPASTVATWEVPPVEEPGSVAAVLDQLMIPDPVFTELTTPCVPLYRRQFSAKESYDKDVNVLTPSGFEGRDFQTMRWRMFGFSTVNYETRIGEICISHREVPNKVIVDLERLRLRDFDHPDHLGNPHVPLNICPSNVYIDIEETPLIVNHYMGTLEQWLYRVGDKRGQGYRLARYEDLNTRIGKSATDQVRPWLRGFVAVMGKDEAQRLLKGVGALEPLPAGSPSVLKAHSDLQKAQEMPNEYKVGDVVQANYKGDGYWMWAEVSAVFPQDFYNVFYYDGCTEEIATFAARLRREGETVDSTADYNIDLNKLAMETARDVKSK